MGPTEMNTPNNAAALERLEAIIAEMHGTAFAWNGSSGYDDVMYRYAVALEKELATLRATLAQPDALTSQPSVEAVAIPVVQQTAPERIWLAVADDAYYADKPFPDGEEVCWSSDAPLQVCVPYVRADLVSHPSADAPGVAVDDEMVNRALKVWYGDDLEAHDMRAALTAAFERDENG